MEEIMKRVDKGDMGVFRSYIGRQFNRWRASEAYIDLPPPGDKYG